MKEKKWYVMSEDGIIISKAFDSLESAIEYWKLCAGEAVVLETVYG